MLPGLFFFFLMVFAFTKAIAEPFSLVSRLEPGGFYSGKTTPETIVLYKGKTVRLTGDGRFIIGFGRDAELQQRFKFHYKDGIIEEFTFELTPRQYNIQKINGVAKKYVQPASSVLKRIQREADSVVSARGFNSSNTDFLSGLMQPALGKVTGVYGSQRYFNGEPRRPHYGLDFAAPTGKPVKAAADGIVRLADDDLYYSGGTVIIDHGLGLSTSYLHLSEVKVREGASVDRGDLIGAIGATGRVTGPHLDWRVNWYNVRLDPALMMIED